MRDSFAGVFKKKMTIKLDGLPKLGYILTIIFVIAKILRYIDWSWWICFIPMVGGWILVGVIIVLVLALQLLFALRSD